MKHHCEFPPVDGFNPRTVKCLHCKNLKVIIPKVENL